MWRHPRIRLAGLTGFSWLSETTTRLLALLTLGGAAAVFTTATQMVTGDGDPAWIITIPLYLAAVITAGISLLMWNRSYDARRVIWLALLAVTIAAFTLAAYRDTTGILDWFGVTGLLVLAAVTAPATWIRQELSITSEPEPEPEPIDPFGG